MELVKYVGEQIRRLRTKYGGPSGISQEALAKELDVATNTVSRWETGTYRPRLEDLEALSRFFNVSILEFFPQEKEQSDQRVTALLRAARDLPEQDIDELQRYAEFRRARAAMKGNPKKKAGRPRNGDA